MQVFLIFDSNVHNVVGFELQSFIEFLLKLFAVVFYEL